jgi:hypothetical protein
VFDVYDQERIKNWKQFREQLATVQDPLTRTAELWATAPFVEKYLDEYNCDSWPSPWELIVDGKFDNFGIALGIFYTLSLSDKYTNVPLEIYKAVANDAEIFIVVVDHQTALNWSYRLAVNVESVKLHSQLETIYQINT